MPERSRPEQVYRSAPAKELCWHKNRPPLASVKPFMTGARDDFTQPRLRLLAQRAGYICAHPGCRQLTIGPSEHRKSGLTMVGVGAHITAASPEGPRYDGNLTAEERASEENGIWMCQLHGKRIDDNADRHTAEDLKRWKSQHHEWVYARIASADSLLKHGITSIAIENVGPFRQRTSISWFRRAEDNAGARPRVCLPR